MIPTRDDSIPDSLLKIDKILNELWPLGNPTAFRLCFYYASVLNHPYFPVSAFCFFPFSFLLRGSKVVLCPIFLFRNH